MTVTIDSKTPLVVPQAVRRRAGFKTGQQIEFTVSGGVISIHPKSMAGEDELTAAQRRTINARLAQADADIKVGRVSKAYSDPKEFLADLDEETSRPSTRRLKRPGK